MSQSEQLGKYLINKMVIMKTTWRRMAIMIIVCILKAVLGKGVKETTHTYIKRLTTN